MNTPASTMTGRARAVGLLCGLAAALIWAGWTVATRLAVTTSLSPFDVTFLRFGVSALFLWPILLRTGPGEPAIGVKSGAVMLVGAGIPFMLLAGTGARFAPASHIATLMNGTMPIFVALLATVFLAARFSRFQRVGLAAVVAGVLCIGAVPLLADRAAGEWRGDLMFLAGGFLFATFTIAQRKSRISPWRATAFVNVASTLVFAPVYFLWLEPGLWTARAPEVLFQAIAQGIGVAILGMFFYGEAVRRLGAPQAAIFGALAPAFAVLLGIPVLGEIPGPSVVAGVILVMSGVWLVAARA